MKINIFWFRRDLRLHDNTALTAALCSDLPILPVFIFDKDIISELTIDDPRITFIHSSLENINRELIKTGSSLYIVNNTSAEAWKKLVTSFEINEVFINKDYEPYTIERDNKIEKLLNQYNITLRKFKDQVIFEESEILKGDGKPYTVFTPYKNRWLQKFSSESLAVKPLKKYKSIFFQSSFHFPSIEELGFRKSQLSVKPYDFSVIKEYHIFRDIPGADKTSYLSPHLRFGTVSIRELTELSFTRNKVFLSELIWREFFMQILFHFPKVVTESFRQKYDDISWRNNEKEFEIWCKGETGYPIVDAGMRQLNETGYMHNRIRMITASFLCKHLLIDWRWGETYFAEKLLDYELSSNNGNWQWAAGTGCDAAPYFRVFNPYLQQKKFDPEGIYTGKWAPDSDQSGYPAPVVEHSFARERAISSYRNGLKH